MKNIDKIRAMSARELAKELCFSCCFCIHSDNFCKNNDCYESRLEWLNQESNPMPKIQIGDVLEVVLKGGNWYDGICVAKGVVYIMGECICKEITEVKIKAISRWSSGSMEEIWRADNGQT